MPLKTHMDEPPTLNLTSMMDVVFLLLIFFLVATKFTEMEGRERNLDLQVPKVSDSVAATPAPEKREINVYEDGRIALDLEDVTLEQLVARLTAARQEFPEIGVVVRGDGRGRFQRVAEVLNACDRAGISKLGISVRIAGEDEP